MKKNGFTLVELLSVIVILGLVIAIAVPSVMGVMGAIQKNMLKEKASIIAEAATLLGEDIKGSVMASDLKYKNYSCKSFIVSDLVPDYLKKDNDNECLTKDSSETVGCVVDPSDKDNYLDKYEVIIYYQNKRIKAVVDIDNNLTCS